MPSDAMAAVFPRYLSGPDDLPILFVARDIADRLGAELYEFLEEGVQSYGALTLGHGRSCQRWVYRQPRNPSRRRPNGEQSPAKRTASPAGSERRCQFPETRTVHCPRRSPVNGCGRRPASPRLDVGLLRQGCVESVEPRRSEFRRTSSRWQKANRPLCAMSTGHSNSTNDARCTRVALNWSWGHGVTCSRRSPPRSARSPSRPRSGSTTLAAVAGRTSAGPPPAAPVPRWPGSVHRCRGPSSA